MVYKEELERAIAEIERLPSSYQNCEKLSVFYTVYNQLYGEKYPQVLDYGYSQQSQPQAKIDGDSAFIQVVNAKGIEQSLRVIIELIDVIQVTNPRLYAGVMRKLYAL